MRSTRLGIAGAALLSSVACGEAVDDLGHDLGEEAAKGVATVQVQETEPDAEAESFVAVQRERFGTRANVLGVAALGPALKRHDQAWELEDPASGARIAVKQRGAKLLQPELARHYAVYRGAWLGADVLAAQREDGFEDYALFEAAPRAERVEYEVSLEAGVAGLRLVSDAVEFLDAQGAPRLRMASPFIVDALGKVHPVRVDLPDCAYDQDPAPPWDRPVIAPGSSACTVALSWGDLTYPALLDPAWTSTGLTNQFRAEHTVTLLSNGRALSVGGFYNSDGGATSSVELYDPATGTWAYTGALSAARAHHGAVLLNSGQVLVGGGLVNDAPSNSVALYNPTTGTWAAGPALLSARWNPAVVKLADGRVAFFSEQGGTTKGEVYSPSTGAWTATANSTYSRPSLTATLLQDGRVLIVGGSTSEIFQPTTLSFSTAKTHLPRSGHTATRLVDGKVLVAGGAEARAQIYDPAAASWSEAGSLTTPRFDASAALLSDGAVLISGGRPSGSGPLSSTEIFQPGSRLFSTGPTLQNAIYKAGSVTLASGSLLRTGGWGTSGPSRASELYAHTAVPIVAHEYRFPPVFQPGYNYWEEIWAQVRRPQTLIAGKKYPVVFFVHGVHNTCGKIGTSPRIDDRNDYALTGSCPSGYEVVKNHEGYAYLAEELARREFITVSINWNRVHPVNFPDENGDIWVRQLIKKHVTLLSRWNLGLESTPASLGVNLTGKLDLKNFGYVGHSRGGYYWLASSTSEYPEPLVVKLRVDVTGFVPDGDYPPTGSLKYLGIFGTCDADTGIFAIRQFNAATRHQAQQETNPSFKSTWFVFGANHNFFNSEWQQSEQYSSCPSGVTPLTPLLQRQAGVHAVVPAVVANVGAAPEVILNRTFDPLYKPSVTFPRIERGYLTAAHSTYSRILEDFDGSGHANTVSGVTVAQADPCLASQSVAGPPWGPGFFHPKLTWTSASSSNYFQANFAASGSGVNLSAYETLDLRVDRSKTGNLSTATSFKVSLVSANGTQSSTVDIGSYLTLDGPKSRGDQCILPTARIPLSAFTGISLSSIRGVRLTFSTSTKGSIIVANIRASRPVP